MTKISLTIFSLLFTAFCLSAQNRIYTDSLKKVIASTADPRQKIIQIANLCGSYSAGLPDSAIVYGNLAIQMSE